MSAPSAGVATNGFPQTESVVQMLYWMGNDYVGTLVSALRDGLLKQDPGTHLISVHCAGEPGFETAFKPKAGTENTDVATRMNVTFPLEVVVMDTAQRQ